MNELSPVIGSPVPNECQGAPLKPLPQGFQEAKGFLTVAGGGGDHKGFPIQQVDGSEVGLSFFFICNGDFDSLGSFAPDITKGVAPKQMTFIHKEDNSLFQQDRCPMMNDFFLISSRLARTFKGSRLGFRFCDFFQEIPA